MARSSARNKRKSQQVPGPQGAGVRPPRPGVQTLDPETEREINGLFLGLTRRMGTTVIVMAVVALGIVTYSHATKDVSTGVFFLSIVIGLLISFWRRVGTVFVAVRQIGIERYKQHRYADAVYILEHFHRLGNMGFDADGEAHYYLALAYLAIGQLDKATHIEAWMRRHRARSGFTPRATVAVTSAAPSEQHLSPEQHASR